MKTTTPNPLISVSQNETRELSNLKTTCGLRKPVNICFIIDNLGIGGTENYLLQQIDKLDPAQFNCHLCLLNGSSEASRRLEPVNIPVIRLGVQKLRSVKCLKAMKRLKNYLQENNIQLIQTHFFDSTFVGILAAKWAGKCRIVKTRRDLVFFADRFQRWFGRPINIFFNRVFVDGFIANSEGCKNELVKREAIGRTAVVEVIPNGVELGRFDPNMTLLNSLSPHRWKIGIVSMLRPEKNVSMFVEVAGLVLRKYPDVEFLIAGDGTDRVSIIDQIQQLGIADRVSLRGRIVNVPEFLSEIQIGVLTSLTEGMPNSIVEYMAAGNTVVATAVGGTCELIQNRRNGLLVPSNDAQQMANAIFTLIENPEFCYQLAKTARLDAERSFDVEVTLQRHQDLYQRLIDAT